MDSSKETQAQILQMKQFILSEAKDKAEEISARTLQEFSVEKQKYVNECKEKIRQEYVKKMRQIEMEKAIARSSAINKSRLEKIRCRQEIISKIQEDAKVKLVKDLENADKQKEFITNLIVQGLLMLLESSVKIRCRASDDSIVRTCLESASKEYSRVVKEETGATKEVTLSLDEENKLPPAPSGDHGPSCLGGVVLSCQGGSITIDNTIDSRLDLVLEQAKPTIRKLLFTGR